VAAVLIQADDFSGAAEVGQCFATQGLDTRLLLSAADAGTVADGTATEDTDAGSRPDVLVVDTHSRAVTPDIAAAASATVFGSPAADGARILFKKIDSLWRGNVGPELAALSALGHHVVVAGALPQLSRTVVGGRPFADGVRLDGTDLWQAEAAVPPAEIAQLLRLWFFGAACGAVHGAVRRPARLLVQSPFPRRSRHSDRRRRDSGRSGSCRGRAAGPGLQGRRTSHRAGRDRRHGPAAGGETGQQFCAERAKAGVVRMDGRGTDPGRCWPPSAPPR
jgi:hypothetical protein